MTNDAVIHTSGVQNERSDNLTPDGKALGRIRAKARQKARIDAGKKARRTPLEVALEQPTSKRAAINAKCYECQGGDNADSGWQWAIGNCEMVECPLHGHRPYRYKDGMTADGIYRI